MYLRVCALMLASLFFVCCTASTFQKNCVMSSSNMWLEESECPSSGYHYYKVDVDGDDETALQQLSSTLRFTALTPANTKCQFGTCSSTANPGYDLMIARGCLPVKFSGNNLDVAAGRSNGKSVAVPVQKKGTYYIALAHRGAGKSCSAKLSKGSIFGDHAGHMCSELTKVTDLQDIATCDNYVAEVEQPSASATSAAAPVAIGAGAVLLLIGMAIAYRRHQARQLEKLTEVMLSSDSEASG